MKNKKPNIKMSKQEKVLFVYDFALELISFIFDDIELKSSFITDKTTLSDFKTFGLSTEDAYKIENDHYFFYVYQYDLKLMKEKYDKMFYELNEEERESLKSKKTVKIHKDNILSDEEIVNKINNKYNSEIIKEDLDLYLYELAFKVKTSKQ